MEIIQYLLLGIIMLLVSIGNLCMFILETKGYDPDYLYATLYFILMSITLFIALFLLFEVVPSHIQMKSCT